MRAVDQELLDDLFALPPQQVWPRLFGWVWALFSQPIPAGKTAAVTSERERQVSPVDNLLAGSAWELWDTFEAAAPRTSLALMDFWAARQAPKAILILDALSLREAPWLVEQAGLRRYKVHVAKATASELPAETTPFAKALGFAQRSALAHDGGSSAALPGATSETGDLPFADCLGRVRNEPNLIFWHAWPDDRMHDLSDHGGGLATLLKETEQRLTSDDFWAFVDRLATGRRVVITSDHGYAHTGLFPDVTDRDQAQALKTVFKSGRSAEAEPGATAAPHPWLPPLMRTLTTAHGTWHLVLGRKKWKSPGGYPTLAHGGLSLLEVAVPYIELSK